jgi:hypothetical protein
MAHERNSTREKADRRPTQRQPARVAELDARASESAPVRGGAPGNLLKASSDAARNAIRNLR